MIQRWPDAFCQLILSDGAMLISVPSSDPDEFQLVRLHTDNTEDWRWAPLPGQGFSISQYLPADSGAAIMVGTHQRPLQAGGTDRDIILLKLKGVGNFYNPATDTLPPLITAIRPAQDERFPGLEAWPNPATSGVSIFCPEAGTLQLYDSRGVAVLERTVRREETLRLDVSLLPKGLYMARLGVRTARVVKE